MSTQTFAEAAHPREASGKFEAKPTADAAGGLDTLAPPVAPAEPAQYASSSQITAVRATRNTGWAAADAKTGRIIFGNDRRVKFTNPDDVATWAKEIYPGLARVHKAVFGGRATIGGPQNCCPTCHVPLALEVDQEPVQHQIIGECLTCGHIEHQTTARIAGKLRPGA